MKSIFSYSLAIVSAMRMPHFSKNEYSPTCLNAIQDLMQTQNHQVNP